MNNTNENPYATPSSDVNTGHQSRSSIPKVIGIISLIFAILGILGSIGGLAASFFLPQMLEAQVNMGFDKNYLLAMNVIGLITSLWALFIGLKLIKYQDKGRRHFNYYTIFTILMSIVTFFYTKNITEKLYANTDAGTAMDMSLISSLSAFVAPVLMIIIVLLLNQKRVKESLNDNLNQ